ncbi:MAG: 4Fe-4S dicluster domain-containing protein [Thermoleophilia bacterium]
MRKTPAAIDVNTRVCTGCRLCEVACSMAQESSMHPAAARIHIVQTGLGPFDIPVICHRCSDAPCVAACPPRATALTQDPVSGVVTLDAGRCLRGQGSDCRRCARVCPAGAVRSHPESDLPMFCDLCGGSPACVPSCAFGALAFLPGSSFDGRHYARRAEEMAADLHVGLYGRTDVG